MWRYAIAGGLASTPLTLAGYWRSGFGSHMSLSWVLLAGVVAGYLAAGRGLDVGWVGLRAGLVGALPGLWMSFLVLEATFEPMEPPWFRAVGVVVAVLMVAFLFFVSGVVGYLGGKVGGWLAVEDPPAGPADRRGVKRDVTSWTVSASLPESSVPE